FGANGQIRPIENRFQVSYRGTAASAVARDAELIVADRFFGRVDIEIPVRAAAEAEFYTAFDERLRYGRRLRVITDGQRPAPSAKLIRAAAIIFRATEVWQDILVAPAIVAQVIPMIKVEAMAANEDHRIRGTCSAERLAAVAVNTTAIEPRLG